MLLARQPIWFSPINCKNMHWQLLVVMNNANESKALFFDSSQGSDPRHNNAYKFDRYNQTRSGLREVLIETNNLAITVLENYVAHLLREVFSDNREC